MALDGGRGNAGVDAGGGTGVERSKDSTKCTVFLFSGESSDGGAAGDDEARSGRSNLVSESDFTKIGGRFFAGAGAGWAGTAEGEA